MLHFTSYIILDECKPKINSPVSRYGINQDETQKLK